MVAVENMTNGELRAELSRVSFAIADRQDLLFRDVSDKQIISALLCELSIRFAEGYLYKLLQEVANKARRRGLLSNPIHNQSYSTAVGNTERMKPSALGWAQTQGILMRELHDARRYLRQLLNSRNRQPHGAHQHAVNVAAVAEPSALLGLRRTPLNAAGVDPSALRQPVGPRNGVIFYDRGRPAAVTRATS